MKSNTLRVLSVLSLAIAALAVPSASAGAAAPVRCGDTISGSVTLTEDLRCVEQVLTLLPGASLDLGGHKITGDGYTSTGGIRVPNAGNVSVSNGAVRTVDAGVMGYGDVGTSPGPIRLTGLVIADGGKGVSIDGGAPGGPSPDLQISHTMFINNAGYNVYAVNSTVSISDSSFSGSVEFPDSSEGVRVSSSPTTISTSTFRAFYVAVECGGPCSVTDSLLQDSSDCVDGPTTVSGNRLIRCTTGVNVSGSKALVTITRNQFRQNGIAVRASDVNISVTHNDMRNGTTGVLYRHTSPNFKRPVAVFSFNTLTRNHDGIQVTAPASLAPMVRVGGNSAIDNVDYGINAPGVTDRGGNTASGNGHNPQCVGVVCAQP